MITYLPSGHQLIKGFRHLLLVWWQKLINNQPELEEISVNKSEPPTWRLVTARWDGTDSFHAPAWKDKASRPNSSYSRDESTFPQFHGDEVSLSLKAEDCAVPDRASTTCSTRPWYWNYIHWDPWWQPRLLFLNLWIQGLLTSEWTWLQSHSKTFLVVNMFPFLTANTV